jgi:hypothetical protein
MMNKLAAALLSSTVAFTTGCATETDGALHLTGRLEQPEKVTHIVAANPATSERIVIDMKADNQPDGGFDIALPTGSSWIVTMADANKRGADMRVATLQTAGIDAFTSKTGGTIDFGSVHFSDTFAHGTNDWYELEDALGADEAAIKRMAESDDLALRYSNPDVDGDGEIDALQQRVYRLELGGTYRMQRDGRDLGISDLVTGIRNNASLHYIGTSITASVPRAMNMNVQSGTVTFQNPFYGTALGPATPMVPAGVKIGQPHVKFGELGGDPLIGVVANPTREAPHGTYQFGFDRGTLTFTDVNAPSSASLMAASGYAVPFVQIRTTKPACVVDCDISSVDITWMTMTSDGWTKAAAPLDAKLDFVARMNGKSTYLTTAFADGQTSIQWQDMPLANTGLLRNELSYISTSSLCYVAVTYASELGVKLTSQVQNPACF